MRSNQTNQSSNCTVSAAAAPACFANAENLISSHTLNVLLGVLILSVLRLSVGLIRLLVPQRTALNRM